MHNESPQVKRQFPPMSPNDRRCSCRFLLSDFFTGSLSGRCLVRHVPNADWMGVSEAACRLGLSPATVRRRAADGTLKAIRIGRTYRMRPRDVEAFTEDCRVRPRAKAAKPPATFDQRAPLNAIREVAGLPPLDSVERGRLQLEALAEIERLRPEKRLHEQIRDQLQLGNAAFRQQEALQEAARRRGEIYETAQRLGVDEEALLAAFVAEYWRRLGHPKTALVLAARRLRTIHEQDTFEWPEGFSRWPANVQAEWLEGYHALYFPKSA